MIKKLNLLLKEAAKLGLEKLLRRNFKRMDDLSHERRKHKEYG
jgi:hypothetical protein